MEVEERRKIVALQSCGLALENMFWTKTGQFIPDQLSTGVQVGWAPSTLALVSGCRAVAAAAAVRHSFPSGFFPSMKDALFNHGYSNYTSRTPMTTFEREAGAGRRRRALQICAQSSVWGAGGPVQRGRRGWGLLGGYLGGNRAFARFFEQNFGFDYTECVEIRPRHVTKALL